MKYVLDASVALKWVLPEPDAPKALKLRANFQIAVHELLAPDVFPIEIGHALTRAERQKRISPPAGWGIWLGIMAEAPALHASIPLMPRAYAISSAVRVGIYDCLYVALSERESCQLVTADDRMVKTLQALFPQIVHLSAIP